MPLRVYVISLAHVVLHRLLPPKWTFSLAARASRIKLRLHPRRRRLIAGLLKPFVPEGTSQRELERHAALSRTVRHMGAHTYAPIFRRTKEWLLEALQPQGLEHVEEAKRTGGAIVLSTHAGLTAWVGPALRQLGYPVRLTQRRHIAAEALILMRWEGLTSQVLPYPEVHQGGTHLKALYDLVRAGQWVEHVGDYPDYEKGLKGVYLGFEIRCVRAPWALARLTERPVIPVLILMDGELRHRLLIGEPIRVSGSGQATDAMSAAFQTYLDFAGAHISRMPWNLSPLHRRALIPDA
jgi:lauroyl/myristoyl acyltransferase